MIALELSIVIECPFIISLLHINAFKYCEVLATFL